MSISEYCAMHPEAIQRLDAEVKAGRVSPGIAYCVLFEQAAICCLNEEIK